MSLSKKAGESVEVGWILLAQTTIPRGLMGCTAAFTTKGMFLGGCSGGHHLSLTFYEWACQEVLAIATATFPVGPAQLSLREPGGLEIDPQAGLHSLKNHQSKPTSDQSYGLNHLRHLETTSRPHACCLNHPFWLPFKPSILLQPPSHRFRTPEKLCQASDARVSQTSEILGGIRALRQMGWEEIDQSVLPPTPMAW